MRIKFYIGLFIWASCIFSKSAFAQITQVVWNDNFDVASNWTINLSGFQNIPGSVPQTEGVTSNQWKIGIPPLFAINDNSLYITCRSVDCVGDPPRFRSIPDDSFATNVVARRKILITPGSIAQPGDYKLKFEYKFPKALLSSNSDGFRLVYWIPNSNGSIPPTGKEISQQIITSTALETFSIDVNSANFDPAIFQRGMYIGFRWFNRNPSADDNSVIIDNLMLEKNSVLMLNSIQPTSICSGDSVQLKITAGAFPPGTNLVAELVGTDGTVDLGQAGNGIYKYQVPAGVFGTFPVRIKATGNFPGDIFSDSINLTIDKKPDKPTAGVDAAICSGAPDGPVQIGSPGSPEFNYSWSELQFAVAGSDYSYQVPEPFITNNGNALIEYSFIVTATNPNNAICLSRDTVKLKVYPNPRISIPLTPESACDNSTNSIPLNITIVPGPTSQPPLPSTAVSTGIWTGQNVSLIGNNSYVFNPAGLPAGTVTLTYEHTIKWTTNGPTCKFDPAELNEKEIIIEEAPKNLTAGPPQVFCSNLPLDTIEGYTPIPNTTFSWTGNAVTPDGFFNPSNSLVIPPQGGIATKTTVCTLKVNKFYPPSLTCSAIALKDLIVKNPPSFSVTPVTLNAGPDETICSSVAELPLTGFFPIGSTTSQTVGKWSGPGILTNSGNPIPNDPAPKFKPNPGITTESNILTYTYTDADGCTGSDTKIVFVKPSPIADAGPDQVVCGGKTVLVGGTAQPKVGYRWTSPNAAWFFPNANGAARTLRIPNNTSVDVKDTARVLATDSISNCKATDYALITIKPVPRAALITPADTNSCEGKSIRLKAQLPLFVPKVDSSKYEFQWFKNGFPVTPINKDSVRFWVNGTGYYQVSMSFLGKNCFNKSDSISLRFNPTIKPRVVGEANFCGNTPLQLWAVPANPAFGYEWKYQENDATDPIILPGTPIASIILAKAGKLVVSLSTNYGCKAVSDTFTITRLVNPIVRREQSSPLFCENSNQYFYTLDSTYEVQNNTGGFETLSHFKFRWRDATNRNIILSDSSKFFPKAAGTYYLDVYNNCGTVSDTFQLSKILPAPQFGILANGRRDTTVCLNQPFSLTAPSDFFKYKWTWENLKDPGSYDSLENVEINNLPVDSTGSYNLNLQIEDQFGCKNDDSVTIKIVRCRAELFIPTAFMPVEKPGSEQERKNSMWFYNGYGIVSTKWYIYNRWGEMVAFGNNYGEPQTETDGKGWDGTFQSSGEPCPTGSYKYVIEYTGQNDNATKKLTGDIMLIR